MQEIFAAGLHESINQSIKSYANKKELLTHPNPKTASNASLQPGSEFNF
jgi:hypothetical protein